ncbi:hypothetical protein JCM3765_003386 [Sporobolomyces pararoseus]
MFRAQDLSEQDLVDHLCVAVEEKDVKFIVLWERLMKKRGGIVGQAYRRHSWKETSAIELACSRGYSQTNKLILEILLHGCDNHLAALDFQRETRNARAWAAATMKEWFISGKAQAEAARKLVEMRSEQAEKWIKAKVPPPAFPEKLTGLNPLPPRPTPAIKFDSPPVSSSPDRPPPPALIPSAFPLPPIKPAKTFAPRPILKKRSGRFPSPQPLRQTTSASPSRVQISPLKLDQNGKPIFKPSEICRLAIYRLPPSSSQRIDSLLSSAPVSISNVVVVPQAKQSIVFCTVPSKKEMQRLIEWGDSNKYMVERAPPSNPNLTEYYHILVRGLSNRKEKVSLDEFRKLVKSTRCGAFECQLGFLDSEFVGLARVGTQSGGEEAVRGIMGRAGNGLRVSWGVGRGPSLISLDSQEEEEQVTPTRHIKPEVASVKQDSKDFKRARRLESEDSGFHERPSNRPRTTATDGPSGFDRVKTWRNATQSTLDTLEGCSSQLPFGLPPLNPSSVSQSQLQLNEVSPFSLPPLPEKNCSRQVSQDSEHPIDPDSVSEWEKCSLAWIRKNAD